MIADFVSVVDILSFLNTQTKIVKSNFWLYTLNFLLNLWKQNASSESWLTTWFCAIQSPFAITPGCFVWPGFSIKCSRSVIDWRWGWGMPHRSECAYACPDELNRLPKIGRTDVGIVRNAYPLGYQVQCSILVVLMGALKVQILENASTEMGSMKLRDSWGWKMQVPKRK